MMLSLSFIPAVIEKTGLDIPNYMEIVFILFCFLHFILGEANYFYYKYWWWDSFLHLLSGFLIAIVGYSIISTINQSYKLKLPLSFTIVFMVSFTLCLGALWEIFEFTCDEFLQTNMQRYKNVKTNIELCGHLALNDTIKDLILDLLGSIILSLIIYPFLKKKEG